MLCLNCASYLFTYSVIFLCLSFLQVVTPESTRQHRLLAKFETVLDAENSFCCVLSGTTFWWVFLDIEVDGLTSSSIAFPLCLSLEGVFCLIFLPKIYILSQFSQKMQMREHDFDVAE